MVLLGQLETEAQVESLLGIHQGLYTHLEYEVLLLESLLVVLDYLQVLVVVVVVERELVRRPRVIRLLQDHS